MQRLGPKAWKGLHVFGGLFAAGVFTNSYVGRIQDQPYVAAFGLSIMMVAIGLQISKAWRWRQRLVSSK
jgi:methionine sulfoxide reductase heme-binding subunit